MNEPIEAACAGNALVQGAARDPAQCVWCVERCHAYPHRWRYTHGRLHTPDRTADTPVTAVVAVRYTTTVSEL